MLQEAIDKYNEPQRTMETMTIVIDRNQSMDVDKISLFDFSFKDGIFDSLATNFNLSISFEADTKTTTKSYLYWGDNQRVRFFSQHFHTLLPYLFDKRTFNGSAYQRQQLIHSQAFKNGIGCNLDDTEFANFYKRLTDYDFLCPNVD